MPLPDGLLVKSNSNPRVYVIETGQRHWIPDPYTLEFYGGWPAVNIVSESDLNAIPEGARKPSRVPRTDGVLLKGTGPKVYVMDQGQKRWVPDPPTLVTLGGWSKVINIADQDLNTIPDGAPYPSA